MAWLFVPDGPVEYFTICSVTGIFKHNHIAYKEWCEMGKKTKKHPVRGSPVGGNALLMLEVSREWDD